MANKGNFVKLTRAMYKGATLNLFFKKLWCRVGEELKECLV